MFQVFVKLPPSLNGQLLTFDFIPGEPVTMTQLRFKLNSKIPMLSRFIYYFVELYTNNSIPADNLRNQLTYTIKVRGVDRSYKQVADISLNMNMLSL
jgi:hypothetical protein